jgi:hypothetical protein
MTQTNPDSIGVRLTRASQAACGQLGIASVGEQRLEDALAGAINPRKLIDNLAEAWRVEPEQAQAILERHGFGAILARLPTTVAAAVSGEHVGEPLSSTPALPMAGGKITVRAFNPAFNEPIPAPATALDSVGRSLAAFLPTAAKDVLGVLYREAPAAYAERFLRDEAARIDRYVRESFAAGRLKYLVNSGIGANEQFNYLTAALANARPDRRVTWLLANSPKEIAHLPADATVENTLFMEFSRSGITEETVKLHELTPRAAKRVVFANTGPLRALGQRDGNLVLELPSEVSGRYGRNKTPILMAPMHVAGLDVRAYWASVQAACDEMNLSDRRSPPVVLARYIRLQQLRRGINHIYFGTNDRLLLYSADEFCQYWNEGVNRDGNDITMSRYLGLPRDSHMNLEAILGTSEHKLAIFLLRTGGIDRHPLLLDRADPHNPAHAGLTAAEVDLILTLANAKRCSEKMPTIVVAVDAVDFTASAWLGQLWADTTLVYSRLIGVDAGSNPEVKAVRTRAAGWLAKKDEALALLGGL